MTVEYQLRYFYCFVTSDDEHYRTVKLHRRTRDLARSVLWDFSIFQRGSSHASLASKWRRTERAMGGESNWNCKAFVKRRATSGAPVRSFKSLDVTSWFRGDDSRRRVLVDRSIARSLTRIWSHEITAELWRYCCTFGESAIKVNGLTLNSHLSDLAIARRGTLRC